MIKFLNNWIEGIAISVILVSLFEMILPNGNLKKYIKIILGIYIVFNIIAPFVDSKALYNINIEKEIENYIDNNNSINSQNMNNDLDKIYANTFEKELKQTVEKKGYNVYKCKVEGVFSTEKKETGIKKISIIIETKNSNYENKDKDKNKNTIDVDEVENINIKIGEHKEEKSKISENDIKELKKYLSEHYEIEQKLFDIQVR